MIDLHTHSLFSDGELIPSELVRRAMMKGYKAIAITDHMDSSNLEHIIPKVVKVSNDLNRYYSITVIPGVELTHIPPDMFEELVKEARAIGAKIVVAHGETIVEPVIEGTNRAAIEAGVDILAHPGLIEMEDLRLAKELGVTIEISARKGHCLSNGYVTKESLRLDVPVVLNTDAHSPTDLISKDMAEKILLSAGVPADKIRDVFNTSESLVNKAMAQ